MSHPLDTFNSIPEAFLAQARQFPNKLVYVQAQVEGNLNHKNPRPRTQSAHSQVEGRVRIIAHFLKKNGLQEGERVAIISGTRPEWLEADLGILCAGGVVVSVYPSLTAEEAGFILYDSKSEYVFVENEEQLQKLRHLLSNKIKIVAVEDRPEHETQLQFKKIITFEETTSHPNVMKLSDILGADQGAAKDFSFCTRGRKDLATIVYTSGTTGAPKGVMQTHGNHLSNVRQAYEAKIYFDDSLIALFLPLAHSFAKLMGYVGMLTSAGLEFPAVPDRKSSRLNQESVARDMREGSASVIPVVPRLLEKIQEGISRRCHGKGLQSKLLNLAVWAAQKRYQALKSGTTAGIGATVGYLVTTKLRKSLKGRIFGRNFQFAVSGGAKLQIATNEYFDALGINILEGYGLTETCVATNVNRVGKKKIGTVGPVLSNDIEVKIASDGEILFRGPNIATGYYQRPKATAEAWDVEGWFHTGDLGALDADGYLSITGRKKELIITAGGKKIPPDPIEQKVKESPLISQAVLVGDEKPYCALVVTLDPHAVKAWAKEKGIHLEEPIHSSKAVQDVIWAHIEKVNSQLSSYETMKRVKIIPEEFTIENGLLTPTQKVKRKEVLKRYKGEIESLFEKG